MVYLFGWFLMFFVAAFQYMKGGKFLAVVVILYCAFIAFFRGNVGTDTITYIGVFESIGSGSSSPYGEPLFILISRILVFLSPNSIVAVKIISLIFFSLLIDFLFRADNDERFFLMSFYMPAFAYSYSMNALRLGLASAIFLYVLHYFRRNFWIKSGINSLFSILLHYSSLFFIFYLVIINDALWRRKNSIILLCFMLLVMANFNYIEDKFSLYENFNSPGEFSGLRVVFVMIPIMFGIIFSSLQGVDKMKNILIGGVFVVSFYTLAKFSYAGLRMLELVAFSWPASVLVLHGRKGCNLNFSMKVGFFLSGLMFSVAIYLGYIREMGEGDSPFLPYNFSF